MATITPTQSYPVEGNKEFLLVSWENLQNGDDGEPFILSQYADRSVHVMGTFGVGGTVELQGSNNTTDYIQLTDNLGNGLSFTTPTLRQVMEIVGSVKPSVTDGDGSTSISIYMLVRS